MDYYINIIKQYNSNSSKFWKCLRELDTKSKSPPPPKLNEGETELKDPTEIATCFNNFVSKITQNYLSVDNRPAPNYENLKHLLYCC